MGDDFVSGLYSSSDDHHESSHGKTERTAELIFHAKGL